VDNADQARPNEVTEMLLFASALIVGSGALVAASPMVSDGGSALADWIRVAGVAGLVAGLLLIQRIRRSVDEAEDGGSPWRSHSSGKPGPSVPLPSDGRRGGSDETGRGLRGWRLARLILAGTIALDAVVVLLVASAPNTMGGGVWFPEPPRFGWLIPAFGLALHLAGLAWMIRIVRADPERHPSFFRSSRS
jgi:hypothetical protein